MSDGNSCHAFASFFKALSEMYLEFVVNGESSPAEAVLKQAKKMWTLSYEFDFADYDMNCDSSLVTLGLARWNGSGEIEYLSRVKEDAWE